MIKMKTALVALAALSLCAAASAANLVQNGSFEKGLKGWTLTGSTIYTGVLADAQGIAAPDGADDMEFGAVGSENTLSQSLATVAGQEYQLSFDLANTGTAGPDDFTVSFGGVSLFTTSKKDFGFKHETIDFVAGAGDTLTFTARNDPAWWLLDDVKVKAVAATPVPESSSTAMLLAGLGLLGFAASRRRRSR